MANNKMIVNRKQVIISVILGMMCFIIVYLLCIQFRTIENIDVSEIEAMREDELRASLAEWKSMYQETEEEIESTRSKIAEYKSKIESDEETGGLLEEDLKKAKMLLGLTDVQGQGVIIRLIDNDEQKVSSQDLLELINELNSAGAEAISINDQRIIAMTDIFEVDSFIMVNEQRLTSPYTIKAIGDITYLQSALSIKNGYIDKYKTNGYTISMDSEENVQINKYNGELKLEYAQY